MMRRKVIHPEIDRIGKVVYKYHDNRNPFVFLPKPFRSLLIQFIHFDLRGTE